MYAEKRPKTSLLLLLINSYSLLKRNISSGGKGPVYQIFCALAITDFEILHFIMKLQRPLVLKCQYQNKLCIELLDVHSYNYH